MSNKALDFLYSPIHASTLSLFRIFFGVAMVYQCLYYIRIDYAFQFMAGPEILFSYPYLEFIQPMSVDALRLIQWLMLLASVFITIGFFTRWASAFFFFSFSYFTLIDKTLFNNHLYLFMLLALLFAFTNSERCYSLRNKLSKGSSSSYIDSWQIYIFRFIVFLVYFYGGVMKLDGEWLSGRIVEAMLMAKGVEGNAILNAFFTFGGVGYDLFIGFLLLYSPTRTIAVVMVLFFNLTNHFYLFDDIGVFPFAMIACTVVFFNPERTANFLHRTLSLQPIRKKDRPKDSKAAWTPQRKGIMIALTFFVAFQLLFPFRYLLFSDNPEWSGIASRFAWRMKMQTRSLDSFDMTVQDLPGGQPQTVDYQAFLTSNQQQNLINDPYNIIQLSQYLAEEAKRRGMTNPTVRADVVVSYNRRPSQRMIVPEIPLEQQTIDPFAPQNWLMPLQ